METEDGGEQALWSEYRLSHQASTRDQILARYEPLARAIAARLYGARGDDSVAFADYLQYGRMGLIEAVERYDVDRNVPFAAFSSQRIRGAILNGIAKESEVAAQRSYRRGQWQERVGSLKTALCPQADRASLADIVTITVGLAVGVMVEGLDSEQGPADPHMRSDPYALNELRQLGALVRKLLAELPEKERFVVEGHYVAQLEFQALAEQLGVTKGRVSQIHAQALLRLRRLLEQQPRLDRKL